MAIRIQFLRGSNQGESLALGAARTFSIGRDPECDILLEEEDASRRHAVLTWDRKTLSIEDSGSRNGLYVNGERVHKATLKVKDVVVIADTVFVVETSSRRPGTAVIERWGKGQDAPSACPALPELGTVADYHRIVQCLLCIQEIIAADRDDILERSVEALFAILPATRLSILALTPGKELKQLYSATEDGPVADYVGRSFAERAIARNAAILANEADTLPTDEWGSTMRGQSVRAAMAAPIYSGERPVAVLVCDNLENPNAFGTDHLGFLEFAARGLEAVFQRRDMREMEKRQVTVDRQLTAATVVQRQILKGDPKTIPGLTTWRVHHKAALEVGGDFYDFHHANGTTIWVLADVSGKGVPAALVVSMLRAFCKTLYPKDLEPAVFLKALSDLAIGELTPGMFFTALAMSVDPAGRLLHAAAGQDGALIARADGGAEQLPISPALLGMPGLPEERLKIVQHERQLGPGDRVMACTDGVTEAGPPGDMFGARRTLEALQRTMHLTVEGALAEIVAAVRSHQGGPEQKDDITVIMGQREA